MTLFRLPILALGLILGLSFQAVAEDKALPDLTEQQVERIVRDYLLKHPEVIVEALQLYQERQELAEAEQARQMLVAHRDRLDDPSGQFVIGNPEGDVTIVEFFDYRCGFCKRVMPAMLDEVAKDGNVRLVFKEFPVLGEDSDRAARAGVAAARQGRYYDMHLALMQTRGGLGMSKILMMASQLGLDTDQLKADMDSPETDRLLQENRELARVLQIRGTPGFVIGDTLVPGAISASEFRQLIAEARAAKNG